MALIETDGFYNTYQCSFTTLYQRIVENSDTFFSFFKRLLDFSLLVSIQIKLFSRNRITIQIYLFPIVYHTLLHRQMYVVILKSDLVGSAFETTTTETKKRI